MGGGGEPIMHHADFFLSYHAPQKLNREYYMAVQR